MSALIDFAKLDLRGAFDFSIMIEEDAQTRYERLARLLGNDPGGAGDVFRSMVATEGKHRSDLVARRQALFCHEPPRFEISVLDEDVERPDVDDDDLPRTARRALEVAIAAEQRAHAFYRRVLPQIRDPEVRGFFQGLAEEEVEHAALLAQAIAELPESSATHDEGPPQPQTAPSVAGETYPDRALLKTVLPRFDAATQAVAMGVVVEGMGPAEVADALGVSRRTVARKLTRFLDIARRHLAVSLAAATLAGCAGGPPDASAPARGFHLEPPRAIPAVLERSPGGELVARSDGPPTVAEPVVEQAGRGRAAPGAGARAANPRRTADHHRDDRSSLARRVFAQVATRMPRQDPAVHQSITQAILAEAKRAGMDPLLVLALIHVESSFNPQAVSSAGARGLMQLLEPTMRREMERSGLPAADPHDPVANVQAGVRYLRRLIDAFGGEMDAALMAYNAGPNRIRGHLRRGGIPERFHVYPQKVKSELARLRTSLGMTAQSDSSAPALLAKS